MTWSPTVVLLWMSCGTGFLAVISDPSALLRFQGEETDMFRIDMSGFKARGDIATLVGAPKGYQDSKDGGTLTTFMASHPVRSTFTASLVDKDPQAFEIALSRECCSMMAA